MRALVVRRTGERAALGDHPEPAGAVLAVRFSSVNYKDALAVAGRPGVLRSLPLVPGVDAAGTGADGAPLVVTGAGLGERVDGGFAERVAIDPAVAVRVPERFGLRGAAAIGTAGVTAALAVLALEGVPDGPVLVTGAGGGVGGYAIALLAALGREVVAATGQPGLAEHLRALGAAEVVGRLPGEPGRPLATARWAGVVDALGGAPLANAVAATLPGGAVAACGLAASADLPASVLPFILRGVTLAGIASVDLPRPRREAAWALLDERLPDGVVERLTEGVVGLAGVPAAAERVLEGEVRGRVLVDVTA